MQLTDKQAAFVREYAVDKNGTQAAIRAGYSPRTAREMATENLAKPAIRSAVDAMLNKLAVATETDALWVRRRLKEEGEDFGEGSTASARVRAVELVGKINGVFEVDNKQRQGIFDDLPEGEQDSAETLMQAALTKMKGAKQSA